MWIDLERGEDPIHRWDHRLSDPPPRQLTASEREIFMNVCAEDLLIDPSAPLQKVNDYIELFTLLQRPENLIKGASGQYIEKPVSVRLVSDMTNEMAQELTNLPRYTAYAKVIQERAGEQIVLKRKIKPLALPEKHGLPLASEILARSHALVYKPRTEIDAEIRQRQERWRRPPGSGGSPPGRRGKPPPTSE